MPNPTGDAFAQQFLDTTEAMRADFCNGFTTNYGFDPEYLAVTIANGQALAIQSLETSGEYHVQPLSQHSETKFTATIRLAATAELADPAFEGYQVTIVRAADGRIHIRPGWPE